MSSSAQCYQHLKQSLCLWKAKSQVEVGIIYGKTQQTSLWAGESLITAWRTTDGIILTQKNAERDIDSLSRDVLRYLAFKWDPSDWNS